MLGLSPVLLTVSNGVLIPMTEFLTTHEPALRLGAFLSMIIAMAIWEGLAPRRRRKLPRMGRWAINFAIVALNTLLLRLIFPAAVVGVAIWTQDRGWGLFNLTGTPAWIALPVAVIILDLVIYGQHVVFHKIPLLWRLHRMHHTDLDFDFTTAVRFHPVEILLSILIKFAAVIILGASAAAVIVFEVILSSSALFNHGNGRLPPGLDRFLRLGIVTPDMHRVHHSVIRIETDSNYGFALSIWDRLFGTYRQSPEAGHEAMTIGLPDFQNPADTRFLHLMVNPLR